MRPLTRSAVSPETSYIRVLVSGAILVLPSSILIAPHLGEAAYILLAILGLYYFIRNGLYFTKNRSVLLFSLLTLGFYLAGLVSGLVSDSHPAAPWKPGNLREFLAAPFIVLSLFISRVGTRFLMLAIKLSALLVFIVVFYQMMTGTDRPGGAVNPLVFAIISLLLGCFSIIRFPLESVTERLLSLTAFTAGVMACVISQSRAVWLLSVFLFTCILFAWYRTGRLTKLATLGITTLILIMTVISLQLPAVQQRINSAQDNYQAFHIRGEWDNSLGRRIIMWKSGLSAAMKKPVFGWGTDQTQVAAASQLESPAMKQAVLGYNHLHNEYITSLVAKGIPGLLVLLLLLFVPLVIFVGRSTDPERLAQNGIGILLCIGYALSALTNQAFGDDTLNIFFIFFLAITLPDNEYTSVAPD